MRFEKRLRTVAPWTLLLALVALLAAVLVAQARPPAPAGAPILTAGHLPGVCTAADTGASGYAPLQGYYYSSRSSAWISAPACVPKWGNLQALHSQIVRSRQTVTMVAVPDGGSNSGEYAPQTKSITWDAPGKPVSGCGSADLRCTVRAPKAGKEWQWGLFHVTMPRTFFIDSPGSNCAGQHLCAGFATNAWGYVGVAPKGTKPPKRYVISGTVRDSPCGETQCSEAPVPYAGVAVTAKGPDGASAITGDDGTFKIKVRKGAYKVSAALDGATFYPATRSVTVAKKDVPNVTFDTCPKAAEARSVFAQAAQVGVLFGTLKNPCGLENTWTIHVDASKQVVTDVTWDAQFACTRAKHKQIGSRKIVSIAVKMEGKKNDRVARKFTATFSGDETAYKATVTGQLLGGSDQARISYAAFDPNLQAYPDGADSCRAYNTVGVAVLTPNGGTMAE